ncbi:MAG: universal stress protein [Phycisphaerae bacterium]
MDPFNKIGVFLTDGPADDAVLGFAGHIARAGVSHLSCIHIRGEHATVADTDAAAFETRVRDRLAGDVTLEVQTGSVIADALKSARDKDLDLVLMGRYLPSSQLGLGARMTRLARKCPCSVMTIPDHCRPHFSRILVAVDGSRHSTLSMSTALALAAAAGDAQPQLLVQTVRHVDPRHDLAGVTFEESADAQREHGRKALERFMADIDTQGTSVETVVSLAETPARAIVELATARKMDIVVVGSRGATAAAAAILGSVSEEVLATCAMPVLIVKEKGETLRLLEALFSMD